MQFRDAGATVLCTVQGLLGQLGDATGEAEPAGVDTSDNNAAAAAAAAAAAGAAAAAAAGHADASDSAAAAEVLQYQGVTLQALLAAMAGGGASPGTAPGPGMESAASMATPQLQSQINEVQQGQGHEQQNLALLQALLSASGAQGTAALAAGPQVSV